MVAKTIAAAGLVCVLTLGNAAVAQNSIKVGLLLTLSGGAAILGEEIKRGWDLGVNHVGGKIGGIDTEVQVVDDQVKPDVAVTAVERLINQEKVDVIAGVVFSNVMVAIYEPVFKSNTILLSTNAGPPQLAGKQCNPLFLTTSWQNDQYGEGTAVLMERDGIKNAFVLAPNYQAGKDVIAAFDRGFKGQKTGEILFKLGQADFQPELSEIRAKRPESVMIFAPAAMGVAFMKQWRALDLSKQMRLYTLNMVDSLTLPAMGDSVVGTSHVSVYDPTLDNPANRKFADAFQAKYGRPPTQYAMQAYDGVQALDSGIRKTKGNVKDRKALVAAMRQADFQSPRGPLSYNINNFPIQNMYKLEVVAAADGKPVIKGGGVVIPNQKDWHYTECGLTW